MDKEMNALSVIQFGSQTKARPTSVPTNARRHKRFRVANFWDVVRLTLSRFSYVSFLVYYFKQGSPMLKFFLVSKQLTLFVIFISLLVLSKVFTHSRVFALSNNF